MDENNYKDIIVVIFTIYTFISESLPFIKSIKSNGIMHFIFLCICNSNEYQTINNDIEINESNDNDNDNDKIDGLEVLFNKNIKNIKNIKKEINDLKVELKLYNYNINNIKDDIDCRLSNLENKIFN